MFTGIVEELGKVSLVRPDRLTVKAAKVLADVDLGASIAVNGTCLTVTDFTANSFSVGIQPETLRRTNIGLLKVDDEVNLERPLALGEGWAVTWYRDISTVPGKSLRSGRNKNQN